MGKTCQLIFCLFGICFSKGIGQIESSTAWLNKAAISVDISRPLAADASGWKAIKAQLKDKRIIMLGEQSHGDGATFEAKVAWIRFLHRELGFKVLAVEGGFYDFAHISDFYQTSQTPSLSDLMLAWYKVWGLTEEVYQLNQYLSAQPEPLEIFGLDPRFNSHYAPNTFVDDLRHALEQLLVLDSCKAILPVLEQQLQVYVKSTLTRKKVVLNSSQKQRFLHHLHFLESLLSRRQARVGKQASLAAWWIQQLRQIKAWLFFKNTRFFSGLSQATARMRDSLMAANLLWLAETYRPNEKIIVWAATAHLTRNHTAEAQTGFPSMGQRVWDSLQSAVYVIGFSASEGQFGLVYRKKPWLLSAHQAESWEAKCVEAGLETAFIDLQRMKTNRKENSWPLAPQLMRPHGYLYETECWPEVMDALFFIKTMRPPKRLPDALIPEALK